METRAPETVRALLNFVPPADPDNLCPAFVHLHLKGIVRQLELLLGEADPMTGLRRPGNFGVQANDLLRDIWGVEALVECALLKQRTKFEREAKQQGECHDLDK